MIPGETPFIMIPEQGSTLDEVLNSDLMPLLDDMTPSAIQMVRDISEKSDHSLTLEAILFYTDSANDWQPVWISHTQRGLLSYLKDSYQKRFEQNNYSFQGHTIEKLFISDRTFFALETGDWMIFSESSLGLENMIRTLNGENSHMELADGQAVPGSFILNTPGLEHWVQQVAQVTYRPYLINLLSGSHPVSLSFETFEDENPAWRMSGEMSFEDDISILLRAISAPATEFTLDRYIPMNAVSFGLFHLEPRSVPAEDEEPSNELEEYLDANLGIYQDIAAAIESETGFAAFAESGPESASEYLFLRKINSASDIRSQLNRLAGENLVIRDGNTYAINSRWMSRLLGSELNPMTDFYVTVYNQALAISSRKGLAESIGSDASRRRVMYYDDSFMEIKNSIGNPVSSLLYVNASEFGKYVQPWLYPQNYLGTLLAPLEQFVMTTQRTSSDNRLELQIHSFESEAVDEPFRERWIYPLNGQEITGKPVLADITGSARNEIIFSTVRGEVFAIANDGTTVLQIDTGSDLPTGPPVVYDWYGNNQNVIMQAAGNKIFAWNNNGNLLPNFPIELSESITTPLVVQDVRRNGVAEVIVGTSDRNIHILNERGQPISGWPQSTNAIVTDKPLISNFNGQRSLFVFAENTLHSWNINGQRRSGFPVFMPSQMHGAPSSFKGHLVGAGFDGSVYAVGHQPLFADTLANTHASDSIYVQSLQVSNNSLNATPSSHDLLLRDENNEFMRDEFLLLQSSNGSLFLYDDAGKLILTRTMGQPGSDTFAPITIDIDRNQRVDLVALADYGRLYAWDIVTGRRLLDLPTTGMKYPVIADVNGDGNHEIIAHTRDGLRSWTILKTRMEEN
jgi:hypothetical protein